MKGSYFSLLCIVAMILVVQASSAFGEVQYTITDLDTLGGTGWSNATGINDSGQVVGVYSGNGGHAFVWSNGTMTDLGSIGGGSYGRAINDSGQVVGDAVTSGNAGYHAFLYSNGHMTDLGALGGEWAAAKGINNSGQVVGIYRTPNESYQYHAFLYSNGLMADLDTVLGMGYSDATGINDSGQVVGMYTGNGQHAFLYSCSNGHMMDLGTLGGTNSGASGITSGGQIVGLSQVTDNAAYHAFLYSNGHMTDLGVLGGSYTNSSACGANNAGQVVGASYIPLLNVSRAFLYSNGAMSDLNNLIDPASGWTLTCATAINDNGQIVGYGRTSLGGDQHAFLLTPVPEPATFSLLAVGLSALLTRHRRVDKTAGKGA